MLERGFFLLSFSLGLGKSYGSSESEHSGIDGRARRLNARLHPRCVDRWGEGEPRQLNAALGLLCLILLFDCALGAGRGDRAVYETVVLPYWG